MNNSNINYLFLNCTKEVIYCLEEAKKIAILKNPKLVLKPIHLCLSLIFNSKLVQKVLNINSSNLNKKTILNIIFNYESSIYNLNKTSLSLSIDKDILLILNILNTLTYPFNTLLLFYYLCKQNPMLYSFIFSIIKIDNINDNFILIKNYIYNFLPKINIPTTLNDILKTIKKNNNILGREKEIEQITEILTRNLNRNVVLLGDNGIGKSAIVQKLISLMPDKIFLELNTINLIANYNNDNLIQELFDFFKKYNNIILYCKNIHLLFDNSTSNLNFLRNSIYELLHLNKLQIIGTSSIIFYDKILQTEEQLKFLFSKICITEPEKNMLILIMKQYLKNNNIYWIKDNSLETIIDLSNKFIKSYVFPKKGFLILDSLLNKYNKFYKEKNITRQDILTVIAQYSELPSTLILKESSTSTNISNIDLNLKKYVFGQDIAVTKIATSLKRAYTGLKDKNKPIGS